MSEVKISIITINFNNKAGLLKTMESVLVQKNADFEYVLIDGGSGDGSIDVIKRFASKLAYWVSEKDTGIYNAMNKGIRAANGEFLLFLNSGDFLCGETVLEKALSYKLDKEIVYGDMRINWGNGKVTTGKMPDQITLEHMYTDTLWHPVSFIKKSLFTTFGLYDETLKLVADYHFFFKTIVKNKVETKHIPLCISEYNTEGLSSRPENKILEAEERKKVLREFLSDKEIEKMEAGLHANKNFLSKWLSFFRLKF